MAAISGKGGSVGGSGATGITNFTVNVTLEALESTSFDDAGNKTFVVGLAGATGSFDWNNANPGTGAKTLSLSTGNNTISGNALITSVTFNSPVDGIVNGSAEFTLTGPVTVA